MFRYNKIILVFLIVSIAFNIIVLTYVLQKYSISELYSKLFEPTLKINEEYKPAVMPDIYTKNIMQLSFDKNVKKKEDFDPWKEMVLQKFQEVYQVPPLDEIRVNSVEKIESFEKDNLLISKYTTNAFDGDTIIFYEILPNNNSDKYPSVVFIPGTGNQGARDLLDLPSEFSEFYYERGIALEVAKQNFIVFVIENRGWGERSVDAGSECDRNDYLPYCSGFLLRTHLKNIGYDLTGLQIIDTLQLVKYIQTLNYIDSKNIAVAGLSHGGGLSLSVAVLNPDIKSTVVANTIITVNKTWPSAVRDAEILEYFDSPDLAATMSPRLMYLSWGLKDAKSLGFEAKTQTAANHIKKAYQLFNAEDNLSIVIHNYKHEYDVPSVIEFLNNTLKS